ncbi:hypothetical protein CCB80_01825 [Armatimonadetes bacterium Uphvl-Ar1]|nr:hypothetical protein CCB80_01825 [Armatimonadetes bacterium Uphvl-Ar1]
MEKPDSPDSPNENPSPVDILHDQTEEIVKNATKEIDSIDREYGHRVKSLDDRLKSAKGQAEQQKPEIRNTIGMSPKDAKSLGSGLTIAYGLMGSVIGLWVVGKVIDNIQGNTSATDFQLAPFFAMAGMVIGIVFAVVVTQRMS